MSDTLEPHKPDNGRTPRRLYSAYRWSDRLQWLTSLFKTPAELGFAAASAAFVGTVAVTTIDDAVESATSRKPEIELANTGRRTRLATMFEITGFDKQGRRGVFNVVVLDKLIRWTRGSADTLEMRDRTFGIAQIGRVAIDDDVRAALSDTVGVIAIGTASQEGDPAAEIERARKRASATADAAKSLVVDSIPLWALNLGQYRDACDACETAGTSWQRPFIVVGVLDLQDGTNLGEALADAMTDKDLLPSPASYSAYDLVQVR